MQTFSAPTHSGQLPEITTHAYAGGFTANNTPVLTLEQLEAYSQGTGGARERRYKCPFCGANEKAFNVNVETGAFNCKRAACGVKGRLFDYWPELQPQRQRVRLRSSAFDLKPIKKIEAPETDLSNWRDLWLASIPLDHAQAKSGREYLAGRGACLEAAKRAGVQFHANWSPSLEGKKYRGAPALIYPIQDRAGEMHAVGGRYLAPMVYGETDTTTGATKTREIKSRIGGVKANGAFWAPPAAGFDWKRCEAVAVVEGPFDALALSACGVPALAMNGTSLPDWLHRFVAFKSVFVGSDNDEAGDKAAEDWETALRPLAARVQRLKAPEGLKDFAEVLQVFGRDFLTTWLKENAPALVKDSPELGEVGRKNQEQNQNRDLTQFQAVEPQTPREIAAMYQANQNGPFIRPTAAILATLRALNSWTGLSLPIQSLGSLVSVVEACPTMADANLLDFFLSGLDERGAWTNPNELAAETEALAHQRADQHKAAKVG